jgi:protein-disulfide isomerase
MRLLVRIVAVIAAVFAILLSRSCGAEPRGDAGAAGAVDVAGLGFFHGDPAAPLQIVEFTDPACPYCAEFHAHARDSLFRTYVESGRARWITIPWVSAQYPRSRPAVVAVECANSPGQAETLTAALYAEREAWVGTGSESSLSAVRRIASEAGLDPADLARCEDDPDVAARIERADSLARALAVRGTPTYLIDGFPMMGAVPFAFARRAFDERLAELAAEPAR